ncbi:putative transposable element [Trichonephila clavipes]|nr:putative transposable element [Trichonephila clavipes]
MIHPHMTYSDKTFRTKPSAGGIVGPDFFKNDEGHNVTVNGDRFRTMITNFFIPELTNHDVQELWFQQDGATCHTARATIDLLKDTFGDRLISRFGPVNWPPRSCDLTPLYYFLWGYVKSLVYADKPQTLDHLEVNIRRVIADIRPQMLEKVIENWTTSEPAVALYCDDEFYAAANPIGVLYDSDQVTVWACAIDLKHYTRGKNSQSQWYAYDRCRVRNERTIFPEFGGTFL